MAEKKRPLEPKIEPVPEETYQDLLPYEMERAEAGMDILFGLDRKITDSQKEEVGDIRRSMLRAKMAKKNGWGHSWRPSPDIREDFPGRDQDGMLKPLPPPQITDDPIRNKAVAEYMASLEEDDRPETD